MPDKPVRLDKYIASVTDYSRSEVKKLIRAGRVSVASVQADDPGQLVEASTPVCIDDEALRRPGPRYFMLHKPQGFVSATRDRRSPTVMELLDEDNIEQLHIAGRLDIDTTGLVLITDDGQWAHSVMSPRKQCWKSYLVETEEVIPESAIERFAQGVFLDEDKVRTLPARLELLSETEARLLICEGRFHQVKRMFAAIGNTVCALHREAIGDIVLDEDLLEGEYRALSEAEVMSIFL